MLCLWWSAGSYHGLNPTFRQSADYGVLHATADKQGKVTDVTIWRGGFAEEREVLVSGQTCICSKKHVCHLLAALMSNVHSSKLVHCTTHLQLPQLWSGGFQQAVRCAIKHDSNQECIKTRVVWRGISSAQS